jgi:hypothetical protein
VHWQAPAVPKPAIGTDLDETADILVNIPAQVAFGEVLPVNDFPDAVNLGLAKLVHSGRYHWIKLGFGQDFGSHHWPYAVDAPEGYVRPLSVWHVNTSNSDHCKPPEIYGLALALHVFGVGTNYPHSSFALNHTTFVASGLN